MSLKDKYERQRTALFSNKNICKENKDLFKEFFKYQEYKLKRSNGLPKLDNNTYKTLTLYIYLLKNTNSFFKNKPLKKITKQDIKRVYDDLEEGRITNRFGKPFADKDSYYSKVFKSKPFELAGKKELAKQVIQFSTTRKEEVRFIPEEDFRKLVNVAITPEHKLLLWLEFDIGENINSLLQLTRKDFHRQKTPDSKEYEYLVNLPKEYLKRSRRERSEITNYPETLELLDIVLKDKKESDKVFNFGYGQAKKVLNRVVDITKIKCIPKGQKPTWKDLRSSMACDLLKKGWNNNEVNSRLGHSPSSKEIDKYINFLALDRHKPKKKLTDNNLLELKNQLEEQNKIIRLQGERINRTQEENQELKNSFYKTLKLMKHKLK